MWLNRQEQLTLTVLGGLALIGFGLLIWQRQTPSVMVREASTVVQAAPWDQAVQRSRQVDVNTATVAELERLPQVGPALAQRIVEYRARHGRFLRPEELARVKGIGPKKLRALRDYVTVQ